jgi:hypothetical protein
MVLWFQNQQILNSLPRRLFVGEMREKHKIHESEVHAMHIRSARHGQESYQINSSNTTHQIISLSNSADALKEKEKKYLHQGASNEEGNQEETSLVTNSKNTAGVVTPLDSAGDEGRYPPEVRPVSEGHSIHIICTGGAAEGGMSADVMNRPPGMPSLEEIRVELRKLHPEPDYLDAWVTEGAKYLHDIWLANGFQMKDPRRTFYWSDQCDYGDIYLTQRHRSASYPCAFFLIGSGCGLLQKYGQDCSCRS